MGRPLAIYCPSTSSERTQQRTPQCVSGTHCVVPPWAQMAVMGYASWPNRGSCMQLAPSDYIKQAVE
eukprot:1315509-Amphidinium_carterae.1